LESSAGLFAKFGPAPLVATCKADDAAVLNAVVPVVTEARLLL
jgi:hypothetical protein